MGTKLDKPIQGLGTSNQGWNTMFGWKAGHTNLNPCWVTTGRNDIFYFQAHTCTYTVAWHGAKVSVCHLKSHPDAAIVSEMNCAVTLADIAHPTIIMSLTNYWCIMLVRRRSNDKKWNFTNRKTMRNLRQSRRVGLIIIPLDGKTFDRWNDLNFNKEAWGFWNILNNSSIAYNFNRLFIWMNDKGLKRWISLGNYCR